MMHFFKLIGICNTSVKFLRHRGLMAMLHFDSFSRHWLNCPFWLLWTDMVIDNYGHFRPSLSTSVFFWPLWDLYFLTMGFLLGVILFKYFLWKDKNWNMFSYSKAFLHLYASVCSSVGRSIGPSVGPFVMSCWNMVNGFKLVKSIEP